MGEAGTPEFIKANCKKCGARFKTPVAYAGQVAKCGKCGAPVTLPEVPPQPAAPADQDEIPVLSLAKPKPAPSEPAYPDRVEKRRWSKLEAHLAGVDERRRKGAIICLGIVLLTGFMMPVVHPGRLEFINITGLGERVLPGVLKFALIYPALAGIATIILAMAAKGVGRSTGLICTGLVFPLVLIASGNEAGAAMGRDAARMLDEVKLGAVILFDVAWLALFVGTRTLCWRPASRAAAVIAAAGGVLRLVSLFVPVRILFGKSVLFVIPFELFDLEWRIGSAAVVSLLMVIAVAVHAILCWAIRKRAEALSRVAFWFLAFEFAPLFLVLLAQAGSRLEGTQLIDGFLLVGKFACWILGLLLLVPVGVTDLIVNLTPPPADPVAAPATEPREPHDAAARLEQLNVLLQRGLITREEYEQKRGEILSAV